MPFLFWRAFNVQAAILILLFGRNLFISDFSPAKKNQQIISK
jgi:hypothetical protein